NHMVNHPYMIEPLAGEDEASRIQRLRTELLQSQQEIAQRTGQDHRFMAYPYGEYDMPIKQMLAEEGFMGLGQQSGAIGYDSDFLALPRFPFGGNYIDMNDFKQKVKTLSFNLQQVDPESPVTDSRNPQVTLQFAPGNFSFQQIGCFASGQPMQMEWLDQEAGIVRLSTEQEFTSRRFRYLCTAPDRDLRGAFYWDPKAWSRPREGSRQQTPARGQAGRWCGSCSAARPHTRDRARSNGSDPRPAPQDQSPDPAYASGHAARACTHRSDCCSDCGNTPSLHARWMQRHALRGSCRRHACPAPGRSPRRSTTVRRCCCPHAQTAKCPSQIRWQPGPAPGRRG